MAAAASPDPANKGPKACSTCARAKARCAPGPNSGDKCERCNRLGKDCTSRLPAPPRPRGPPKRSKVAQLEMRLEELSSQFKGSPREQRGTRQAASVSQAINSPLPSERPVGSTETATETEESRARPRRRSNKWQMPLNLDHIFIQNDRQRSPQQHSVASSTSPGPSSTADAAPRSQSSAPSSSTTASSLQPLSNPRIDPAPAAGERASVWPEPAEADVLLRNYLVVYDPLFPFIVLDPEQSAAEIKAQRPFLWKAVMFSSCLCDGARHLRMGRELLADVGRVTLLEGARSLDVLQGLQIIISEFNYAIKGSQLTNLLFLARSMCVNLQSRSDMAIPAKAGDVGGFGNLEHLRAYAGTYYLNTLVFTTNKKTDVFMSTAHLDACCKVLETAMQHPSDEYLVRLVEIQRLAQSIAFNLTFEPGHCSMQLPLTMVVQSFQSQIDTLKSSLSPRLHDDPILISHLATAEMLLKDISTSGEHCGAAQMSLTDRLQLLWSCARSVGTFLNVRFTVVEQLEKPRFFCLTAMSDLAYTILLALKLLMLQLPGWDLEQVGRELRVGQALDLQSMELAEIIKWRSCHVFCITGQPSVGAARTDGRVTGGWDEPDPYLGIQRLITSARSAVGPEIHRQRMDCQANGDACHLDVDMNEEPSSMQPPLVGDLGEGWWEELVSETMWDLNGNAASNMDWS